METKNPASCGNFSEGEIASNELDFYLSQVWTINLAATFNLLHQKLSVL